MRVLHLCFAYPSLQFPGDGSFLHNAVKPLCDAGLQALAVMPVPYVPGILGRFFARTKRAALLPRNYEFEGIPVFVPRYLRLPHALIGERLPITLARAVESAIDQKPDLIHAHYAYPYGTAAIELRRRWRVPVVLTLHGSDATVLPYQSEAARRRFVHAILRADHVLAVSEDIVNRTRDLTGRTAQFWPIGVGLEQFRRRDEKSKLRRQLGLPMNKKLLLFVGQLQKSKGVDQLPALMDRLDPGVHAVVVGDGPVRNQIRSSPRCTWVPTVSNTRVASYLNAVDLMVHPSETEGTPTVLVEAGAAHLPVVATPVGGVPALLAGDRGLLAEVRNMDSLVVAVQAALADPAAGARRADRLYAHISKEYDCIKNAYKLKQLYAELTARGTLHPVASV